MSKYEESEDHCRGRGNGRGFNQLQKPPPLFFQLFLFDFIHFFFFSFFFLLSFKPSYFLFIYFFNCLHFFFFPILIPRQSLSVMLRIYWLYPPPCWWVKTSSPSPTPKGYPRYDTNLHLMITPSWPLLPGPLRSRVLIPVSIPSIGVK